MRTRPAYQRITSPTIPPAIMYFAVLFLVFLLIFVIFESVIASEDYLYYHHDHTQPVSDFVIEAEKDGKEVGKSTPTYLNTTSHGPQVVEFYAPWCPHCQHFKPHYVQLARDVRATEEGKGVAFHAISCTVHKDVCKSEGVHGYPTIKIFQAGNSTGIIADQRYDVDKVLHALGIERKDRGKSAPRSKEVPKKKDPTAAEIAAKSHVRTQTELWSDAAASFNFALHHSIYTAHGPLEAETKNAFRKWLALLHRTLPPTLQSSHRQIEAIQLNFDEAVTSEDKLFHSIEGIHLDSEKWSLSCTKGDHHKGYTCGLWSLFHIMTIGVAEYNAKQSNDMNRISTMDAANSLRDYVLHFFGCEECRKNFVNSYDNCDFNRCDRLINNPGAATEWRELSLWLWETHNAVNVRLEREKAIREHRPSPTEDELREARWPSWKACPRCWTGGNSWDKDAVYTYLKSEYWPQSDNDKPVVVSKRAERGGRLRKKIERVEQFVMTHEAEFVDSSMALASNSFVLPIAVIFLGGGLWLLGQQRQKTRYGKGKKFDWVYLLQFVL